MSTTAGSHAFRVSEIEPHHPTNGYAETLAMPQAPNLAKIIALDGIKYATLARGCHGHMSLIYLNAPSTRAWRFVTTRVGA
jgi:hypothetical protein